MQDKPVSYLFAAQSAVLVHNDFCVGGVGIFNVYRVL